MYSKLILTLFILLNINHITLSIPKIELISNSKNNPRFSTDFQGIL